MKIEKIDYIDSPQDLFNDCKVFFQKSKSY